MNFYRGLISGHIFAEYLQNKFDRMKWYKGELLNMAVDVGYRLLPAFNSTTGKMCFCSQSIPLKSLISGYGIFFQGSLTLEST